LPVPFSEIENVLVRTLSMETPRESGGMQNKVYSEPHPPMMEVVPEDKRL